ncbi:T6SS effector BTH_I2691 family protein [Burkholderia ubonensis]|uniref:T6SS effector BTH_I2691 family protein n=1 Tax=Burkholderia ubonensis TaxID=101571 RepID=UPI002FC5923A
MATTARPASSPTQLRCPICDKFGLPILPVRYAVARTDMGHAPALPKGFGAGVADIELPADSARYTLRTLRAGYLYVFDEQLNHWSGYVVNEQSYLWEFNIREAPPKVDALNFNAACRAKNDPYLARCFTVADARYATKVWIAFSTAPWTAQVLKDHGSRAHREAHMQCIDVAAWIQGASLQHMGSFDTLPHIAEFAADAETLRNETRAYLQRFLPAPYKRPQALLKGDGSVKSDDKSKQALDLISPLFQEILKGAVARPKPDDLNAKLMTAAWAFSPQPLRFAKPEAERMSAWAKRMAQPYRPAVVGVVDPVGIAMELNGLAIQRALEYTEQADLKWEFETVGAINAIRKAVINGAMVERSEYQQNAAAIFRPFVPGALIRHSGNIAAMSRNIEQAGMLTPDQILRLETETWPKYVSYLNPKNYQDAQTRFTDGLNTLDTNTIGPLDQAYVAWLKSRFFVDHFTHNFDPNDIRNGVIYQQVVHGCIIDASGRRHARSFFNECLGKDPMLPDNPILRALIFNHQKLATTWSQSQTDKNTSPNIPWRDISARMLDAVKDTFVKIRTGENLQGPFTNISKYLFQLLGPVTERLGKVINKGVVAGMAALPERRLIALMLGVARAQNPHLELIEVSSDLSPKQAARTLARAVNAISGGGASNLYKSAEDLIVETRAATSIPARGMFLVDSSELSRMGRGYSNAQKLATVDPQTFESLLTRTASELARPEIKAGVVVGIFAAATVIGYYGDYVRGGKTGLLGLNFGAAVTAFLGITVEVTGRSMQKMPWLESAVSRLFAYLPFMRKFSFGWLIGAGKWLGVAGGVGMGVVTIIQGFVEKKYNFFVGILMVGLGGAVAYVALAAVYASLMTAGVYFLIGMLIAVSLWAVSKFQSNAIQQWMAQSKLGRLAEGERFGSLLDQQAAFAKLAGE